MRTALVLSEWHYESFRHGSVAGEEIDALGMQKSLLRRGDVSECDLLTSNIISHSRKTDVLKRYDLAIHFFLPTIELAGARNVLFFQQFWEYEHHDIARYRRQFDLVMTPSARLAQEFSHIYYLPLAVDAETYRPMAPDQNARCQVVFVGNFQERGLATYRQYLTPALAFDLAIYGSYWDDAKAAEYGKAWRGLLPLEEAARAYCSADLSLCIHGAALRERWELITSRVYHSLACERMVVSDGFPALRRAFPEGTGVVYSDGGEQSDALLREHIADPLVRSEIAQAGRAAVLAEHTWDRRVGDLMAHLGYG